MHRVAETVTNVCAAGTLQGITSRSPVMTPSRRTFARSATRALAPWVLLPLMASAALPAAAWGDRVTGSGRSATETRTVAPFEAIATKGSIDIVVRQGSPAEVQVQADDNLLELLETVVEEGRRGATLQVRWKSGTSLNTKSKVLVNVTTPTLTALAGSGSGDFTVGPLKTPALRLSLSGSGDARFDGLAAGEFTLSLSGSSDVRGNGEAGKVSISIAGSGDVDLIDLRSEEASVSIAGSGDAKVNASKQLKISVAGSGDVTYSGDAAVSSRVAGSGSITKR
jgi:hypothetical protein